MEFKQIKAIERTNKIKLLKAFPFLTDESGIYVLTREENGFKYAYIGQAKHVLTRLAQHLVGYQHIDLSLKKHGLKTAENTTGWEVCAVRVPEKELNEREQAFIRYYANAGYQLRNKTAGGQGEGKFKIAETRPRKTYQEGVKQGYEKARKEVGALFEKNLDYSIKGKENKNKLKAYEKFKLFVGCQNE